MKGVNLEKRKELTRVNLEQGRKKSHGLHGPRTERLLLLEPPRFTAAEFRSSGQFDRARCHRRSRRGVHSRCHGEVPSDEKVNSMHTAQHSTLNTLKHMHLISFRTHLDTFHAFISPPFFVQSAEFAVPLKC